MTERAKPRAHEETGKYANHIILREKPLPPASGNHPSPEVLKTAPGGKPYRRPFEGGNNGTPYEVGKYKVRTDKPLTKDQEIWLRKAIPEYIEKNR